MKKTIILSTISGILLFLGFQLYNHVIFYYKDEINIKYLSYNIELLNKQKEELTYINDINEIKININIINGINTDILGENITEIDNKIKILQALTINFSEKTRNSELYKSYMNIYKEKYIELIQEKENIIKLRELGFYNKSYNDNHVAFLQKKGENSCVFNSINTIFKYEYGYEFDINDFYGLINKEIGEYWDSGYFIENGNYGYFTGSKDYKKLNDYGFKIYETNDLSIINKYISSGKIGLIELPLSLLNENYKGKLWHAINITKVDGNNFTYTDSLDGKIKILNIKNLINNGNLYYPIKFIYIDNSIFLNRIHFLYNNK